MSGGVSCRFFVLWQTIDAYESSGGERTLWIALDDGDHVLELRNRRYRNRDSSGNKIGFKQLDIFQIAVDEQVIDYTYDALSRLLEANYNSGETVYQYGFDVAGNLINLEGTTRTYNAGNQLVNDGTNSLTYDANGNLTNDGVNAYTWDRGNRLLSVGSTSYGYDGLGNRISQDALQYLLDIQPGLTVVLGDSDGNHYVHGPRGIHAQKDSSGNWEYMMQDGLGSVRGIVDVNNAVIESRVYDPIGNLSSGSMAQSPIGFTGEFTEGDLIYLRARYLSPNLGVFNSLDPFEGMTYTPMSLNGYSWVEGNLANLADASGMQTLVSQNCSSGTTDDQISCNYANWLLRIYPESASLDYWLRFGANSLRQMFWERTVQDIYAFVPLDFQPNGSKEEGAVDTLRRMEISFDRPLMFSEILAMIWVSEIASIYDVPAETLLNEQREHDKTTSAAGNSMAQFQRNLRTAVYRLFHGECRREDQGRTGVCGANRLIGDFLSGIEGWYNSNTYFSGWETYFSYAQLQQSSAPAGGGAGGGECGEPYTWGNLPSREIPLDPPIIGQAHIIDWIYFQNGDYKYFVLQEPSFCGQSASKSVPYVMIDTFLCGGHIV